MKRMLQLWAVFLQITLFAIACEETKDTRDLPASSGDATDEQLATSPAPVTGSYLRCGYIDDPNAAGFTPVGCNPYDQNNKIIDLDVAGSNPRWSYDSRLAVTFSKNYVDAKGYRWQGRFDFAGTDVTDRVAQILETLVTLSFVKNGQGQTITLQDKIKNLLMDLAEHRYIKIAYQSIHMNSPTATGALPDSVDFEFLINDAWEKVRIRVETVDMVAHTMQSDLFAFKFIGSDADWRMYLGTGMGKDLADKLSAVPDALKWKTAVGNAWQFDPTSSFQSQEPYDLKAGTKPIEMIIDMGSKKRFHGVRLDSGLSNPGRQFPNGFPDRFYFLYSDDGLNFTKINGSEIGLDRGNIMQWSWDP